ncbi:MAG: DUF6383 domain-containing protein [Candidatus Symbiothrix sp.]|jgi:hypothetical protein|nr:DUF6383 domain-containing protein [Candidatus Symbiothrix sp.]
MKKNVLFGLAVLACSVAAQAQNTCYTDAEASAPDFWTTHFYFATCTDYVGTNSKLFEDGSTGYVDFNGGSSVDFTNIYVPSDAEYTVMLRYGIGWADESGATLTLNVNGDFVDQLVLFPGEGEKPWAMEFDVELYGDYNNTIQLVEVKDWPIILGIQLTPKVGSEIKKIDTPSYQLVSSNGKLTVSNLENNSRIRIYSIDGKLIQSVVAANSFQTSLVPGVYVVKVNGEARKAIVK